MLHATRRRSSFPRLAQLQPKFKSSQEPKVFGNDSLCVSSSFKKQAQLNQNTRPKVLLVCLYEVRTWVASTHTNTHTQVLCICLWKATGEATAAPTSGCQASCVSAATFARSLSDLLLLKEFKRDPACLWIKWPNQRKSTELRPFTGQRRCGGLRQSHQSDTCHPVTSACVNCRDWVASAVCLYHYMY